MFVNWVLSQLDKAIQVRVPASVLTTGLAGVKSTLLVEGVDL